MKISIAGCTGKMGKILTQTATKLKKVELVGVLSSSTSPYLGTDIGELCGLGKTGIQITNNADDIFSKSDVVIDFSTHEASTKHAELSAEYQKKLVIGTTGFTTAELNTIKQCATQTAIVLAPNMSIGINLLLSIVEKTAAILDTGYDIEILEMHHKAKVDAPSGTALALGKAAAAGRGIELNQAMRAERFGNIGKRIEGEIGFATLRGGDVVGDHSVIFAADGERIEFSHKASSREVFALGAYRAAFWLYDKPAGFYSMKDVLEL